MPYYNDAKPLYAQQNPQQRVTPLVQEMYTPPQYLQQAATEVSNSVTEFFTKYWWTVLIVILILVIVFYIWYNSSKSSERIVEF